MIGILCYFLDANRQVYARVIMRRVPNAYDPEALPLEVAISFQTRILNCFF